VKTREVSVSLWERGDYLCMSTTVVVDGKHVRNPWRGFYDRELPRDRVLFDDYVQSWLWRAGP
jgi:hypothetical protein